LWSRSVEKMKNIVDILRQEIIDNNYLGMKIDYSDVCRLLLCGKYEAVYSPSVLNNRVKIDKEKIKLTNDPFGFKLTIGTKIWLTISDTVTFEATVCKFDDSFNIFVNSYDSAVGIISFKLIEDKQNNCSREY
jgi:hypothetical protein